MLVHHESSEKPLGKDFTLKEEDSMETTLLIRTISKIAGLIRVGFGEADARTTRSYGVPFKQFIGPIKYS